MFDFVQEKRRLVQIVLALIILPFALWGVSSYTKSSGVAPLAKVDGEKITQQEFDYALNQQEQRFRKLAGSNFDPTFFDKPDVKFSILNRLINQRLMQLEARKAGLIVTDEEIGQIIVNISDFQKDGKFDKQTYETVLKENGKTPSGFDDEIRQAVLVQQLTDAYTQNGYASNTVADRLIHLNEQQRVIATADIDAAGYMNQVKLPDSAIDDYYKKNTEEFQIPERAKVDYVVLSPDALMPQVTVSDDEVKQYYQDHQSEFGTQEQRHAAHILISVPQQASEAERQAAKAKAEHVLQLVKQAPAKFAEFAKQYSQDAGSAAQGGDIGMITRGAMGGKMKEFDDALFSLKTGEISGLVKTDFGYHIIKLIAVKPATTQPLSAVKSLIVQRLKLQRANDKFDELAENFSNTVYEQSDTLKPAAELAKIPVQQGVWLSKGQAPAGLWTEKALQAVFSEDAIKNKRNTAAVEVAPNTLLAARVTDYKPAGVRPLSEVSASIRQKLQRSQAAELALQEGKRLLDQLQHGEKANVKWKAVQTVTRNERASIAPELLQAVFRADASKLPAYVGVDSANGYLLARIDAVKDVATIDDAKRNRYEQQIRQMTGDALLTAYMADARQHTKITVNAFTEGTQK